MSEGPRTEPCGTAVLRVCNRGGRASKEAEKGGQQRRLRREASKVNGKMEFSAILTEARSYGQ